MKRAWLLLLAGCVDASDPPWQLRHERIVAVRTEPAGIVDGETALIDGLLAHADGSLTDEQPVAVTVVSPKALFTAVHYNIDHWQIDGIHVDAPTTLAIEMRFAGGLVATKQLTLGERIANPPPPQAPTPALHVDLALPDGTWLTDCGEITGMTWRIDAPCDGTLVGVARGVSGVSWTISPVQLP